MMPDSQDFENIRVGAKSKQGKTKKIAIYLLLLSSLVITGCGKDKSGFVPDEIPVPKQNVPEEIAMSKNRSLADPMIDLTETSSRDSAEVANIVESFQLETPNYLSCLNQAVQNCQREAVDSDVREKKNPKACEYLSDKNLQASCKDQFWYQAALEGMTDSSCSKIKNILLQHECLSALLLKEAVSIGSVDSCSKMDNENDEKECQNNYYSTIAVKELDESYCEKLNVNYGEAVNRCKETVMMEKNMKKMEAEIEAEALIPEVLIPEEPKAMEEEI